MNLDTVCKELEQALSLYPASIDIAVQLCRIANISGAEYLIKRAQKHVSRSGILDNAMPELMAEFPGSLACRIYSAQEWAIENRLPLETFGEAEEIPIADPPLFDGSGFHPSPDGSHMIKGNPPYVAELRNAKVTSGSSIVTIGNAAINDNVTHQLYGSAVSLEYEDLPLIQGRRNILLKNNAQDCGECDAGVLLAGFVADSFGHWVPEFLPKLRLLERHPDFRRLPIIVEDNMPQSHFDYLGGIAPNPLIRLPKGVSLLCRRLIVASAPTFYPTELFENHLIPWHEIGALSPAGLTYLRDRMSGKLPLERKFGSKLYITRRNMRWRRVSNDDEIAAFLGERGFETVEIEKLSLADQASLFRHADVIVAPNGSSLLNMIYAPASARIIALSQPGLFNWGGFYGPMRKLGYNSLFLTGDEEKPEKHADYPIPVSRLAEALDFWR